MAVARPNSDFAEWDIATINRALNKRVVGCRQLTEYHLRRIGRLNHHGPELRAVIEVNPEAISIADALDREARGGRPLGPLHGTTILIKDNIETLDHMMTTAGSLALEGWYPRRDAPLVSRLRAAGAVILGKSNMSEWGGYRGSQFSGGWSARGGQTRNAYAPDRTPFGSSSGSAVGVTANLCTAAIGTETDSSIVGPASGSCLVGVKPTLGLVDTRGIIPLARSQDTAGPLARTVADAATLLSIMRDPEPKPAAGIQPPGRPLPDYRQCLDRDGLRGTRLGVIRRYFAESDPLNAFFDRCVEMLRDAGATVIDPIDLYSESTWSDAESTVMLYEFKDGLETYLSHLPAELQVHRMSELIDFNETFRTRELGCFGQEVLKRAVKCGPLTDEGYQRARLRCIRTTRSDGIDAVIRRHTLDGMVSMTAGPPGLIDMINGDPAGFCCASPAAVAGYPHITVPAGFFNGLPIGLSFFAGAYSEETLFRLAAGFEHHARARVPPRFSL